MSEIGWKKSAVIIQIVIVLLIITYGTVSLFMGNFEGMLVTFPFLLFYYVWVVARQKRKRRLEEEDENGNDHESVGKDNGDKDGLK